MEQSNINSSSFPNKLAIEEGAIHEKVKATTSSEARTGSVQKDTEVQPVSPSPPPVEELSSALAKNISHGDSVSSVPLEGCQEPKIAHRMLTLEERMKVSAKADRTKDLITKCPQLADTCYPVITSKGLYVGNDMVLRAKSFTNDPNSLQKRDTRVTVFRGCTGEQLIRMATGQPNPSVTNPTKDEARNQVAELALAHVPIEERLVEFSTDLEIAEGFGTGQFVAVVQIDAKYLTKGSGTEDGWVAYPSAPCEIIGWKQGREFLTAVQNNPEYDRATVLARKAAEKKTTEISEKTFKPLRDLPTGSPEGADESPVRKLKPARVLSPKQKEAEVTASPVRKLKPSGESPSGQKIDPEQHTEPKSSRLNLPKRVSSFSEPKPWLSRLRTDNKLDF